MVRFEIKKVLSRTGGKIALLLLLALVLLECAFAFDGTYVNSEGVSTHGIAAVRPLRAEQKKWEGVLDEQRIAQVIGELNRIEALPEAKSDDLIDEEITYSRKQGVSAIRDLLNCSYATGFRDYDYYLADSLTPEQAKDFYPNRIRLLKAWLAGEAKDQFSDEEKQFLIARYEALEKGNKGSAVAGNCLPCGPAVCFQISEFRGADRESCAAYGHLSPQPCTAPGYQLLYLPADCLSGGCFPGPAGGGQLS